MFKGKQQGKTTWNKGLTAKTDSRVARYAEKMRGQKQKPRSEETKKKISRALKGRNFSKEHRKKLGAARKGKILSNETKRKISQNHINVSGKNNPRWKGGKIIKSDGRIYIWQPSHPNASKQKYVQESHLIAEKALGRCLNIKAREIVHHINNNPSDNRNENLLICKQGYHRWLTAKIKKTETGRLF